MNSRQRKPRPPKIINQGTLHSLIYSAAVRSDPTIAKRPRGIEKERPRRSARLKGISRLPRSSDDEKREQTSFNPPADKVSERRIVCVMCLLLLCIADRIEAPQRPQILHKPLELHQKRKREQEIECLSPHAQDRPPSKRPRTSPPSCRAEGELKAKVESDTSKNKLDPIEAWIRTTRWPRSYFTPDSQIGEDFFEHNSWLEEQMEPSSIPVVQYVEINGMKYPRPVPKAPTSLRRKPSDSSLIGSSDQLPREVKSAPYRTAKYSIILATKGSFMNKSDLSISTLSKSMCQSLLRTEQAAPQDSLFQDNAFEKTCLNLQDRNESMVIRDIALLIVPSAQTLATYGATHLNHLSECVNEGWNAAIPFYGPRPQPDYSVGFGRSAFTQQQLKKLEPFVGDILYGSKFTTFFMATYRMYFPFLTCEVKCGGAALDIADRQNAHSMTVAVRGVVELYRTVQREKELHQEILAFSISHDHRAVRIYGHYPIINGNETTFYRHPIREFNFTDLDGINKWTAYKFTQNVYSIWMPIHLKRICSAIDQIPPDLNFEVSQGSDLQFAEASGLSQELGGLLSEQSNIGSASQISQDNSELVPIVPPTVTPDTSVFKRPKNTHTTK